MSGSDPGRRARLDQRRRQMRRFYVLTGLSTLMPGVGLFGTRRRAAGVLVFGGFVAVVAALVVRLGTSGVLRTALELGLDRDKLMVLLIGVLLAAVVWCGAILLTSVAARPPRASSTELLTTRLFAVLCCCIIAFPAVAGARVLAIQRDVVGSVFADSAAPQPTVAVTPDKAKEDPWAKIPRVNILLLGSDAGSDRIAIRPDSIMVASINTKTGDTVLIGLPRNLERVPFPEDNPLHALYPDGFLCHDADGVSRCLLNAIWTEASINHKDLFPGNPDPGLSSTRDVVSEITGLKVNQTITIDLSGFQQLVEAMGGVTVNVQERVCMHCKSATDGSGGIIWTSNKQEWIETGRHHLDGEEALWYSRSRAQSDDFSRMRRQRCVVGALVDQVNPVKMLARYPSLANVLKRNVSVDIKQSDLPAYVDLITRIKDGTIRSLPITNQVVNTANPDFAKIRKLVRQSVKTQPTATATSTSTSTPTSTSTKTHTPTKTSTSSLPDDGLSTLQESC